MGTANEIGFGLKNKVVLITGGSKNIGRSISLLMAKAGAIPVILVRDDEKTAIALCEQIKGAGGKAGWYKADLANVPALQETVRAVLADWGTVDVLVNNAAVRPNSKISDITVDDWDMVINTNLRGPFFLSRAVLPGMIKSGWGRIINMGSLDGYWGKPRCPYNVTAKMGLVGQTRALANEVARFGITVNMVIPGTTDTYRQHPEWYPEIDKLYDQCKRRIPMGRLGMAEEVANACLFLASDLATYTTAQEFFVTGGAFPIGPQPADECPAEEF